MDTIYLGKLIKHLRTQNNMKQEELAEQLGVTTSAISKWETGKNLPDIEKLTELSAIFNVPIEDLCHPEKTLEKLESNNNSNLDNTTLKPCKSKLLIIIISALTLLLVFIVVLYFFIGSNKEKEDRTNAYPFAFRMIEEEPIGSMYEMAIVYSGNLDTLSDPTTDFMELVYFAWCDNTNVPPEITTMKVSFYKTEEEASQWLEPQKSTYFFR